MANISAKKQNRILLVALIVVLSCTAILIAITGSANKSKKEKLPDETKVEDSTTLPEKENTKIPGKTAAKITDSETEAKTKPETETVTEKIGGKDDSLKSETDNKAEKTDAEAEEELVDYEAAAMEDLPLPTFASPINNALVLKDYSDSVPVFSYTMNDYRVHNGLDFAASVGTPVLSAADGEICEIVDDPMMGVCVSVKHNGGAVTKYKGLSNESMDIHSVGDSVACGEVIGSAGDTALIESAEENHVHFELLIDGEHENPADYFKVSYVKDRVED